MPSPRPGNPSHRLLRSGSDGLEAFSPVFVDNPPFPVDNIFDLGITQGLASDREPITTSTRHPTSFPSIQYTPSPPTARPEYSVAQAKPRAFPPFNRPYYYY